MFEDVIETARAGPSAACQNGAKQSVVWSDKQPSVARLDSDVGIPPDGRIDHC
jgi:hypothetical protein